LTRFVERGVSQADAAELEVAGENFLVVHRETRVAVFVYHLSDQKSYFQFNKTVNGEF